MSIELILRVSGISPFPHFDNEIYQKQIEKNYGNYLCNDDSIGVIPCFTGERTIYQANKIPFKVSHLTDGSRNCGYVEKSNNADILLITGDSQTHGDGVDDSCHLGYRLQENLSNYHVINRSIFGSGNVSQLQVLKNSLKQYIPKIVLATYGSYHNVRNIFGRANRKIFCIPKNKINDFTFPYGTLKNKKLIVNYGKYSYNPFPFSDKLAICEVLNLLMEKYEYVDKQADIVTLKTWEEYIALCKKNNIKLCVIITNQDEITDKTCDYFKSNGVETIKAQIPESLTFMPIDQHFNSQGHLLLSRKIKEKLKHLNWINE